jgi:hypothetical protein
MMVMECGASTTLINQTGMPARPAGVREKLELPVSYGRAQAEVRPRSPESPVQVAHPKSLPACPSSEHRTPYRVLIVDDFGMRKLPITVAQDLPEVIMPLRSGAVRPVRLIGGGGPVKPLGR